MCKEHTLGAEADARRAMGLSRRQFDLFALSAAAVAALAGTANAAGVDQAAVEVKTADGQADCFFVHPGQGKHPGVLLWPDFMGRRAAYEQMATRLAESGYAVLVINPYYRDKRSPVLDKADFGDKPTMAMLSRLSGALTPQTLNVDAKACIGFLDSQPSVDTKRRIGTMGYCLGGGFTFDTAAAVPDRVGAIASFHGGDLASNDPDSPHLLIPRIRAQALIAIAQDDDQREPETKNVLREAFAKARLPAEIEVYAGTRHGWCTPDMTTLYDAAQAQRAWQRLLALFKTALA